MHLEEVSPSSRKLAGDGVPRVGGIYQETFITRQARDRGKKYTDLGKKQLLKRARWLEEQMLLSAFIPANLEEPVCDPGNSIQKTGVMSPKEFWHWYHIADSPEVLVNAPWAQQMGRVWGELWFDYLVMDELVLSGAVPLILQKRSQMTGRDEEKAIRTSEVRALQVLRKRIGELHTPENRGGLIITICGRIQIAVFQKEYDVAKIHLEAMRKMMEMHAPSRAEWLCAVWSDLRVASTLGTKPVLPRNVPDAWKDEPAPGGNNENKFQRLAMQNVRALNHVIGEEFALIFAIFRRLHGLQARKQVGGIPIESYYHGVYDSCVLHEKSESSQAQELPGALVIEPELLAICLKLAIWEKAAICIPRGGEIERAMLDRALNLLDAHGGSAKLKVGQGIGATDAALLWMIFSLTATAYMFQRSRMSAWIAHLQSITSHCTPRAFQRALESWPSASWWFTSAAHHICDKLAPTKGRWKVIGTEKEPIPDYVEGLRLKLVVIEE